MTPISKPPIAPKSPSAIRAEIRSFLAGLSEAERTMLRSELSGDKLGLLEGLFDTTQAAEYSLRELRTKHGESFDSTANKLLSFLATISCANLAKRALFLGELQDYTAEEPKTEEIVRESVIGNLERTQVQVIVDDASPMETTQATRFPTTTIRMPTTGPAEAPEQAQSLLEDRVTLRRVVVANGSLSGETRNAQFVGRLTDEGREMVKELLLLEDIQDADAIQELERTSGKSGYSRLAAQLIMRMSSSPEAKNEICEAIRDLEVPVEEVPFARKRDKVKDKLTVSPWASRPRVGAAEGPKPSLAQILSEEFTAEEREELLRYVRRDGSDFDGEAAVVNSVLGRLIQKMLANGMNPIEHMGQLKVLLTGGMPTFSKTGVPFARPRRADQLTVSPWQHEIGATLLQEVIPFIDPLSAEEKAILSAVLDMKNPNDPVEVNRLSQEHATESDENAFLRMGYRLETFIKRSKRPAEDVRKALAIRLEGGEILPQGHPSQPGEDSRRAPTVLSTDRQRGLLERVLRRSRRKKKN